MSERISTAYSPREVYAMQECTEPWAVGCVEGASCKWNGLMHRGKSTVGKEGRDLCKDPNSAFVLFFNDG